MSELIYDRWRALEYIINNGSDLEKARIAHILDGAKPSPEVERSLAAGQNKDGGFPYQGKEGCPSTLSDTTFTLVWLDDLGLLHSQTGLRAVDYVASRQKEDGSWDENPAINSYNPPPWMKPGERAVVVFNTANSLFWLLQAGIQGNSIEQGLGFLRRHQAASGAFEGFRHNTWLAVSVLGKAGGGWDASEVRRGLDFLAGIPDEQWVTSQISWMLWALLKGEISRKHSLVVRMIDLLLRRQQDDGSFLAEDGPDYAVNATIEALKVLHLYEV